MRRIAKILGLNKNTIPRKMAYLAKQAHKIHTKKIQSGELKTSYVQFDEMETFEHTKLKPLSIAIAIRAKTGEIIDTEVGTFAANGPLAKPSRAKYDWCQDTTRQACISVMETVKLCARDENTITIASDKKVVYPNIIRSVIPNAQLKAYSRLDPNGLWRLNHIAAKIRADISRMARRTWSTTKKKERLQDHLLIYTAWNNGYKIA